MRHTSIPVWLLLAIFALFTIGFAACSTESGPVHDAGELTKRDGEGSMMAADSVSDGAGNQVSRAGESSGRSARGR
jgi:hypothetical protein